MTPKQEMVPARTPGLGEGKYGYCKPEWDLLTWVRRELGLVKLKDTKVKILSDVARILSTMNDTFTDWPEAPK